MRSHQKPTWQLVVVLAAVALGAPACGDDDDDSAPTDAGFDGGTGGQGGTGGRGTGGSGGAGPSDGGMQDGQATADAGMLSDGEIIAVMTAANDGEIQQAELAMMQSSDSLVTDFATLMITDHGAANQMLVSLSQGASLPPLENALSEQLRAAASKQWKKLMNLSGIEFDQAYMQAQVKDHKHVLALLDDTLLPQVSDSMLKTLLRSMRSTVAMHLSMARDIVDQLEADGGAEDGGL